MEYFPSSHKRSHLQKVAVSLIGGSGHKMTPLNQTRRSHSKFALSEAMPEKEDRSRGPIEGDIDMPFTMSALETIINFGQIQISTVTLIKKLSDILRNSMPPPEDWDKHQGHSRILYSPDNMKKREGRRG